MARLPVAKPAKLPSPGVPRWGTTPDGAPLRHPFHVVYTLAAGQIVQAKASYDPAPVAALNAKAFENLATPSTERD